MRTKKCITCGKIFSTDRTEQAKCEECLAASRSTTLHYYIKRRKKSRSGIKVCVVCGREIVHDTTTVTCSPECAAAHRKEAQHRADAKRRSRTKSKQSEVKKESTD